MALRGSVVQGGVAIGPGFVGIDARCCQQGFHAQCVGGGYGQSKRDASRGFRDVVQSELVFKGLAQRGQIGMPELHESAGFIQKRAEQGDIPMC